MLITDRGVMIRFAVDSVPETGRATMGVHLIKIDEDSKVATMAKVDHEDDEEPDDSTQSSTTDTTEQAPEESSSENSSEE